MLENLGRSRSNIPSPVSRTGYAVRQPTAETVVYDGQPLPRFLLDHGRDPTAYRQFLQLNRIARIWDLERGASVVLPPKQADSFASHPDA
ncbi:MAG: hypothetical protein SNJ57_10010 [Cyanobacteriota bacterium]